MARDVPPPRPVQVFLDTKRFIALEEPRPFGGGNRDFFENNDRGFGVQKERVRASLRGIGHTLRGRKEPAGFIRVQVRDEALAKSYRPIGSLFTEAHGFALVGAGHIGEMVFQATPEALERLERTIEEKAEPTPRRVVSDKTGLPEFRVSGYRSEVGALTGVELHDAADRVPFSAEEAIAWLKQPAVIGGYLVELFRPKPAQAPHAIAALMESFRVALTRLPSGIVAHPFLPRETTARFGEPPLALSVQLVRDPARKEIFLPFLDGGIPAVFNQMPPQVAGRVEPDLTLGHHQLLLDILAEQSLVRSVELPPLIEAGPASASTQAARPALPVPAEGGDYPVVGIIDGGVANIPELIAWRVADAGLVPPADRDESHGTFIAGLVVAGATLNPHIAGELEPRGCKFFDLDIFPRKDLRRQYFGTGLDYFFDLLDEKIKLAKRAHGVRIFNFSFGLQAQGGRFGYTIVADRLDRLARANDVILVISAGNLPPGQGRPPWPAKAADVTTMLAGISTPQQITPPAEHLLGLTIGAINPPGIKGHESELPTTYTRRGPGIGGSRKPDLAHFGGTEQSATTSNRTGLSSLAPNGDCVENCGTSFASPNASTTLATLDHRLEHAQPREVLLALSVHRASRVAALNHPTLRHIAREFVGFGRPPSADALLVDDPSAISLVFSETLMRRQRLEFPFAWPAELVGQTAACRGRIDLTLAFTPLIDSAHKDEALRVQLEAHLHQETVDADTGEIGWESRLTQDGSGLPQGMNKTERYLLMTGLKWSPIKRYYANMPQGRGRSSNWKLSLESLTRAGATYPDDGVPFAAILTISDPKHEAPIHDPVRNALLAQGFTIADITVAHRVRPRRE